MECPSLNTAKGSDDTFRLKLHCSYTRASWSIASREPSPDQRGSVLSLGSSLIWCASSAPETSHCWKLACNPAEHLCLLSWLSKKRSPIRSRRGQKRMQYTNNGPKAERGTYNPSQWRSSELISGLSLVVTVAHKASSQQRTSNEPRHSTSSTPGEDSCRNRHGTGRVSSQKIM